MAGILASGKIRINIIFFSVVISCPFSSYGAPPLQSPDQPATSSGEKSISTSDSLSSDSFAVKNSNKNNKKKTPKEGVKEAHVGPPPAHLPTMKGLSIPLMHRSNNPIDLSTGQELTPWMDDTSQKVPVAK